MEKIIAIWGRYCQNGLFLEIFQRMGGAGGSCLIQKWLYRFSELWIINFWDLAQMTWWTSLRYIYQQGGEYTGGFKGGLQDGRGEYTGQPSFQVQHSISCQAWSRESTKEGRGRQESTGTSHLPPTQVQPHWLTPITCYRPTNQCFFPQLDELSQLTESCFYK